MYSLGVCDCLDFHRFIEIVYRLCLKQLKIRFVLINSAA